MPSSLPRVVTHDCWAVCPTGLKNRNVSDPARKDAFADVEHHDHCRTTQKLECPSETVADIGK